jgi:uncharacterized protein
MNDDDGDRRQDKTASEPTDPADRQPAEEAVAPRIAALAEAIVDACSRHARAVVAAGLALTILFGWFMATHFGLATDTERLIDPSAPWRKGEVELAHLFPQNDALLVIVVDGETPELADGAAAKLAARLLTRGDLFTSVRRPDAADFFRRNGLLFLEQPELERLTDQLAKAQPLIGALAADPSVNGLFGAFNLALDGVGRGEIEAAALDPSFAAMADSLATAAKGAETPLSWEPLLTGRAALPRELQRIILAKPVLDFTRLAPGTAASDFVRASVADLGLDKVTGVRVRLTGEVALNDEEFSSVIKGTGYATLASFCLVLCVLFFALRSFKPILAIVLTLLTGLVWTLAFAFATVGELNLISIAFAAMFIGIAVDFGIQVCVRYRDERYRHGDLATALRRTGRGIGAPLFLAAVTTAAGFLAFTPTPYRGVSELGIIAGAGMLIALLLNLTLLPALLVLLRPGGEPAPVGYAWAAGIDRFLVRRRGPVMAVAAVLALAALILLPRQQFDFNPLHMKDPSVESVATLRELMANEVTTPNTLQALVTSRDEAASLSQRLAKLPEVRQVLSIDSFIPTDQEAKLGLIGDAALFLLPSLSPTTVAPKPDATTTLRTVVETIDRLQKLPNPSAAAKRLAAVLQETAAHGAGGVATMERVLLAGLPQQLESLRLALDAQPVTFESLPADLKRDWIAPDGRFRVEIYPRGDSNDNATLVQFVKAVQAVAPDVGGVALVIQQSGELVWRSFQIAGLCALGGVVLLLAVVLRRPRDVLLVVAPLLFAALLTAGTAILLGLTMNFANVVALPLLFGIGVAFSIYFVMNWRGGRADPLQSSTARAVLFSGLTTLTAFSSLSLSGHKGTAAMGWLLAIGLGFTLLSSLLLLPALLGPVPARAKQPHALKNSRLDSTGAQ